MLEDVIAFSLGKRIGAQLSMKQVKMKQ